MKRVAEHYITKEKEEEEEEEEESVSWYGWLVLDTQRLILKHLNPLATYFFSLTCKQARLQCFGTRPHTPVPLWSLIARYAQSPEQVDWAIEQTRARPGTYMYTEEQPDWYQKIVDCMALNRDAPGSVFTALVEKCPWTLGNVWLGYKQLIEKAQSLRDGQLVFKLCQERPHLLQQHYATILETFLWYGTPEMMAYVGRTESGLRYIPTNLLTTAAIAGNVPVMDWLWTTFSMPRGISSLDHLWSKIYSWAPVNYKVIMDWFVSHGIVPHCSGDQLHGPWLRIPHGAFLTPEELVHRGALTKYYLELCYKLHCATTREAVHNNRHAVVPPASYIEEEEEEERPVSLSSVGD